MKINMGKTHKKPIPRARYADVVAALEEVESREKARLKIAISYKTAENLNQFLKEKGLSERQGLPMLIQYGLSEENEEELKKLKSEKESQMSHLWGTYAVMKFKAYEYFMENKSLVIKLLSLLSENHSLKRMLEKMEMQSLVTKDEWDDWNNTVIDNFYDKYVFINRL